MALPVLDKTWQFNVNNVIGSRSNIGYDRTETMAVLTLKNAMKSFGSSPWTVWGSNNGNGSFGNNDGIDRWTANTDIRPNTPGNNHSWMVLKQAGLGTNTALCIDANYDNISYTLVLFPTGPLPNGTATARPSASDEVVFLNQDYSEIGYWAGAFNFGTLHVMQSTDGQCTRAFWCYNNILFGLWLIEKVKNPTTGWPEPIVCYGYGYAGGTQAGAYARLNDVNTYLRGRFGINCGFYATAEGLSANSIGEYVSWPDDDTSEWPFIPIGLASDTVNHRGFKGSLHDIWWGSTTTTIGTCYPDNTSKQFAQFGHLIFPWDGSTPLTA